MNIGSGPGWTHLTGVHLNGIPDGRHTGGAWLNNRSGLVYKPLSDARDRSIATHEHEMLRRMIGVPFFPENWWVENHQGQRWLVRREADRLDTPERLCRHMDDDATMARLFYAISIANGDGWAIDDYLTFAMDKTTGQPFIVDCSNASRQGRFADDSHFLLMFLEAAGLYERARAYWAVRGWSTRLESYRTARAAFGDDFDVIAQGFAYCIRDDQPPAPPVEHLFFEYRDCQFLLLAKPLKIEAMLSRGLFLAYCPRRLTKEEILP